MTLGVAVFLRFPVVGRVKTRLAATVGDAQALALYEKLLNHTLATLDALPERFVPMLFGEPSTPLEKYEARFAGPRRKFALQAGPTLTERLFTACTAALASTDAVLCIGTDCPQIAPEHFLAAEKALETHDAVLGPADDGGYWALGTKRAEHSLFDGVPWSTDQVAAITEARFAALHWRWTRLATLGDVDDESDARRLRLL